MYLFAGRTNTSYPSIWIGSMVCCCDTRTPTRATFSLRQLPINQHLTSTTANSATTLANKRRRLALSIHTLSFATDSILFYSRTLNQIWSHATIDAFLLVLYILSFSTFPNTFPSVHTKRSITNTTTSLFPCLLIAPRTSFSIKSR